MPKYISHLSSGILKSKEEIDFELKRLKKVNIDFKQEIDSIQLLTIDKNHSLKSIKNFKL